MKNLFDTSLDATQIYHTYTCYVGILTYCLYIADEMGLWYNEIVPVSELTYANLQEGVPCKDGRFLIPDPLSARIAPLTQPTAMMFTCKPPINRSSHLKTKHLSPGWYVNCERGTGWVVA